MSRPIQDQAAELGFAAEAGARWVMGMPFRVDHYRQFAWALEEAGRLRMTFLWKRGGYPEVAAERTRLISALGAVVFLTARYGNTRIAERIRFRLHPLYDRWMASQLEPGDFVYSSYGYANASFRRARTMGGTTLIDGGNSHPENFWTILSEENERWGVREEPVARFHYERSVEMLQDTDFIVSPSRFVSRSFLERGFREEQILPSFYPVNLSLFKPADRARPRGRPFTIVNTSGLSLRKGTPYLLEAFRRIRKEVPDARFLVTRSGSLAPHIERLLHEYRDVPIEWCGYLSRAKMAERFREADLLMLPSLEDGFARVVTEAMSCGLPVLVSENTGAGDFVEPGVSGSIFPIRDAEAMATEAVDWWERIRGGYRMDAASLAPRLSPEAYRARVIRLAEEAEKRAAAGAIPS